VGVSDQEAPALRCPGPRPLRNHDAPTGPARAILLAFDDTDSAAGGCTTHLAFHVLLALPELALTGMPRLVRLNPNVPWKTRGNGAVVLPLGSPQGPSTRVGELRGHEILAFPDAAPVAPSQDVLDRVWEVVHKQARPEAQPAVAMANEGLPALAYWQAVQTLVAPEEARAFLDAGDAVHRSHGEGRALAGCAGALAWPGPASSYEFIAYRHPSAWGTPRKVEARPLLGLDAAGTTFHTADGDRLACTPRGPDPVLIGLRGRDPDVLMQAATRRLPWACQEPIDGWLLWATNQASGDHVVSVPSVADAPAAATIQVEARVEAMPESKRGGHVFVRLVDDSDLVFTAAAFEPTKGLRDTVRALRPGDRVTAVGAYAEGRVNLEKLRVLETVPIQAGAPVCPSCGRTFKSAGKGQPLRCKHCDLEATASDLAPLEARPAPGWREVPVLARRHLHRPLTWATNLPDLSFENGEPPPPG
jgi:tRNA(Ile2)-agmatinylcytidine synthase